MSLIGHLLAPQGEIMPLAFETLPLTEAEADATYFVVEMAGGSDANEIGVGGGLDETNRTLTRFGTVGASSSGWRAVSAASGFNITSAWADAFIRNSTGFSMLWHMKNCGGTGALAYLNSESPSMMYTLFGQSVFWAYGTAKYGMNLSPQSATPADIFPSADEFYALISVNYTNELFFAGVSVGATQPSSLADFALYGVSTAAQAPIASAITLSANFFSLVGATAASGLQNPAFSIKSVTAKLGASVTLVA